jgi:hypothetical protein
MKPAFVFRALLVAALMGIAALAPAAEDPSDTADTYFRAFVLCNAGMKAVEAGRREDAIRDLKSAQVMIKEIQQSQPGWQPAIVEFRLKRIEDVLKSLGAN